MAKCGRAPGGEGHEPAIQISRFAQKGQGHRGVIPQLADTKPVLFVAQSLHRSISQINHPQWPTDLLLRIQHRKVLQRGAIHNHIHPLLPPIRGNQRDTPAFRFRSHRLLSSQEAFLMVYCYFRRHFCTKLHFSV